MPEGTPQRKKSTRRKAPRPKGTKEEARPVESTAAPVEQLNSAEPAWAKVLMQQVGDVATIVGTMAQRLDQQQEQIESLRSGQQQQQEQAPSLVIDPTSVQPAVPTERDLAARGHLNAAGVQEIGDVTPGFSNDPNVRAAADEYAPPIEGETVMAPGETVAHAGEQLHETRHLRRPEAFHPPMGMTDPSRHLRRSGNETGESVKAVMSAAPDMVAVVPTETIDKVRVGKQWYQLIQGRKMRVPVDVARHFAEKRLIWTGDN